MLTQPQREFRVRLAMYTDRDCLAAIERSQFESLGWGEEKLAKFLAAVAGREAVTCTDKATDQPIAYMVARMTKYLCLIERLVTHRQYERLGAGGMLTAGAATAAKRRDVLELEAVAPEAWMPRAGVFLAKYGFRGVQHLRLYDGWQDYYRFRWQNGATA